MAIDGTLKKGHVKDIRIVLDYPKKHKLLVKTSNYNVIAKKVEYLDLTILAEGGASGTISMINVSSRSL